MHFDRRFLFSTEKGSLHIQKVIKWNYMRRQRGFTLIELLVVIAIIGLLAAIVFVSLSGARESGREARARSDIRHIILAISLLESDTGEWPGHTTPWTVGSGAGGNEIWDLNAQEAGITQNDLTSPYAGWKGPYMSFILPDPWGNPYFFDPDYDIDPGAGQTWAAVVGSFGPNGTVGDADDIILEIVRE